MINYQNYFKFKNGNFKKILSIGQEENSLN